MSDRPIHKWNKPSHTAGKPGRMILSVRPDTFGQTYKIIGTASSLGCIRFRVKDIKWIYDHCNEGTSVTIYSEKGEKSPIKVKKIKKIKESDPYKTWDPTDSNISNPWKNHTATDNSDTEQVPTTEQTSATEQINE